MSELYSEVSEVMTSYKVSKFACKKVVRKYAFDAVDIPSRADYLKVVYPYESKYEQSHLATTNDDNDNSNMLYIYIYSFCVL